MRRMTLGLCLATALAGYAVGQWQLASSASIRAQDQFGADPGAPMPAESDLERKYVEKSRQLFRTLTPEQQQQALGLLDQQLRQAEALAAIKRVEKELREIVEKYPETAGANLAMEAERVLQQRATAPSFKFAPEPINVPAYVVPARPVHVESSFEGPVPQGVKPTPVSDDGFPSPFGASAPSEKRKAKAAN